MKTTLRYGMILAAILTWWYLAFSPVSKKPVISPQLDEMPALSSFPQPGYLSHLSTLRRESVQKALNGDCELITRLIGEWDIDAQILSRQGLKEVKRLPHQLYFQAQLLGRQIQQRKENRKENDKRGLFLPQTYAAASFLLALSDPEEIAAIPEGMRKETHLYPKEMTDAVPCDITRHQSEKWARQKPNLAFVAHYSHPSTLQALQNQGIQLYMLKGELNNLFSISDALLRIGKLVQRPAEAELLAIFMESAMLSLDNRMHALKQTIASDPSNVLFLHYFTHYSIPTGKTITGQLFKRLESYRISYVSEALENETQWLLPVDYETILDYDPDCLIIATSNEAAMRSHIEDEPSFRHLRAKQNGDIYFVDSTIQQSPTQHIVLAYYDLASTLAHFHERRAR